MNVLDHGYIALVDKMGDEESIVNTARLSYAKGTKQTRSDAGLIRYLMRHGHSTPLESCVLRFQIKLPIFVARQWMRYRAGSFNEISGRYSELPDEFYVPKEVRSQSTTNKQGSEGVVGDAEAVYFRDVVSGWNNRTVFANYGEVLRHGVSRELARINLPLSTYTVISWTVNLRNLLHFLHQRLDEHAQWEIQQYAWEIASIVEQLYPNVWDAFCDYTLYAHTFSGEEMDFLRVVYDSFVQLHPEDMDSVVNQYLPTSSKREKEVFIKQLSLTNPIE